MYSTNLNMEVRYLTFTIEAGAADSPVDTRSRLECSVRTHERILDFLVPIPTNYRAGQAASAPSLSPLDVVLPASPGLYEHPGGGTLY